MQITYFLKSALAEKFPSLTRKILLGGVRAFKSADSPVRVETLAIENTNICNSRCTICPQGAGTLTRKPEVMDNETFFRLVDIGMAEGAKIIEFAGIGEFLLDRGFMKKAAYIVRKGLRFNLTTNASLLSPAVSDELLNMGGLNTLVASFDSYDRGLYSSIRKGLDYDTVLGNILYFLDANARSGNKTKAVINATVFTEIKEQKRLFKIGFGKYLGKGLTIYLYTIHNWAGEDVDNISAMQAAAVGEDRQVRYPCPRLFSSNVNVRVDGSVSICCFDFNNVHSLGNIEGSVNEIWNGEKIRWFRRMHLEGRWGEIPLCRQCSEIRFDRPPLERMGG